MNAKNPKFAIPPKGCCNYLTPGKKYRIIEINGLYFSLDLEENGKAYCRTKDCCHLNGKNWILRNK